MDTTSQVIASLLGVGVASGFVSVGVIGTASRLEYTAVGAAVNLASRLCAEAAHGEVLVDERTVQLAGAAPVGKELCAAASRMLKGYSEPVRNFILTPD